MTTGLLIRITLEPQSYGWEAFYKGSGKGGGMIHPPRFERTCSGGWSPGIYDP